MIQKSGHEYGTHILIDQVSAEIGTIDIAMGSTFRGGTFPLIWEGGNISKKALSSILLKNFIGSIHGHLFDTAKTIDPKINPVFGINIPHSNTDLVTGSYQVPKGFITIVTSDYKDFVTESIEPEKATNLFGNSFLFSEWLAVL